MSLSSRLVMCLGVVLALSLISLALIKPHGQQPVTLVYYANETVPQIVDSRHYQSLLRLLEAERDARADSVMRSIQYDLAFFPAAVQKDIKDLRATALANAWTLFIFTNASALKGNYERQGADGVTETYAFPLSPTNEDPLLEYSPLARPEVLRNAAAEVADQLKGSNAKLVFITKTHGSEDMALMPRVSADTSWVTRSELRSLMNESDSADSFSPSWAAERGTSKIEFWQSLRRWRDDGIDLALIIRDSCRSGVSSLEEYFWVPWQTKAIAHSGNTELYFNQLDYGRIFSLAPRQTIEDSYAALVANGLAIETRSDRLYRAAELALRAIPLPLFFIPFVVWLVAVFGMSLTSANLFRRRGQESRP
jgi:hypothetical protein